MPDGPKTLFPTGVAGLDTLLGGGIPPRQTLIITGNPGSGKTVLCSQIAFLAAARGVSVVLASLTSEPHDKLLEALSGFAFFRREFVGEQVFLISAYTALQKGAEEARDLLLGTVVERSARLLFIDDLRSIRDLWRDEAKVRELIYELGIGLALARCVGLLTTAYPVDHLMALPEATNTDGIVSLSFNSHGLRRLRRAEVIKVRGRAHLTGSHPFEIGSEGIRIIPRLEALTPSDDLDWPPDNARAAFGVPELDALMGGGLPAGSATMLAGSMGIGKTLFSSHFALEGARKGEKALFVSFFEGLGPIVTRAQRIGLDLQPAVSSGALRFLYLPPTDGESYVLIDRFLAALSVRLRRAGVTTVFTKEVPKVAGTELDFSDTPIAILGENLILLRYVELRGRIHRILSVLKMRDSGYESDLREFEITDRGIRVLGPLRSVHGLLTG